MSLRLFSRILQLQPAVRNCSYKSAISLDKLYPQSSLSITKVPPPPPNEPTKFSGYIPIEKLRISYSRSSGPGGQNVNKVNTKANVKFNVHEASWLPDAIRDNLKLKFKNHISKDGFITLQSDRTRYQHLNTADALQKLREMLRSCEPVEIKEPTPETAENCVEEGRKLQEKGFWRNVPELPLKAAGCCVGSQITDLLSKFYICCLYLF
ncbi:Peptidyl-tRNA hydrolase ICT1, mitochondrial [Orchesella cincta]|uniref:Large ribosomal subunit protein mL62 n=1 Tax=Orchesella cincta TaxID=48709 RepID=A0A1D2M7T8_ORCCI|nr:Peptidyl-tRNA hydrolase ICT1, mitochondrial [Orchesella cincta]